MGTHKGRDQTDRSDTLATEMLSEFGGQSGPGYARLLLGVETETHLDTEKLYGHVLALSDIADASCRQLGSYLR